jgi:transposase-like protein
MNRTDAKMRSQILAMMAEGVSMQSIARLTGASKNTVAKLLRDAGVIEADEQPKKRGSYKKKVEAISS